MMKDFGTYAVDVSSYTMLLVAKLWGLAWAQMDGARYAKDKDCLTKDQLERKIDNIPTVF